jgi:hypothetical protein
MKKHIAAVLAAAFVSAFVVIPSLFSWGFWAHREINRYAIRSLPKEMRVFFDAHADEIVARSVEPDQRRSADEEERYRHFIDIDRYGEYPFDALPRDYEAAVAKFGKETVDTNGTIPWRIADFTEKLSAAMKAGNSRDIVFYASYLGHYIGDIHVPLHTTENYDGQLSGQKGIHSRWESRIPEMYGKRFPLRPVIVKYIEDPLAYAFDVALESYLKVDSVLGPDKKVQAEMPQRLLWRETTRRGRTEYQFSDDYYKRYYKLLDGMVARRMMDSITGVASCWYTAWVNAGKPDLAGLVSSR